MVDEGDGGQDYDVMGYSGAQLIMIVWTSTRGIWNSFVWVDFHQLLSLSDFWRGFALLSNTGILDTR